MKVVRNGQQVEFSLNEQGSLVQASVFYAQSGMWMPVKNFLLPLPEGENDNIMVEASTLGLARQMVRFFQSEQGAAAESREVAREVAAEEAAAMEDHILEAFRDGLHAERRDLVNLYVGDDRAEKIAGVDLRIAAAEEEQAKRAGLMSSEDILAAFSGTEDLSLEIEAANALPRPANESYEIGQRVICVNLPHIGATVRSLDDMGVGLDYDTDDDEERGTYEALYSAIRPMPIH